MGVASLASQALGLAAARISAGWQRKYGHGIELLEAFVDGKRFRGTLKLRSTTGGPLLFQYNFNQHPNPPPFYIDSFPSVSPLRSFRNQDENF